MAYIGNRKVITVLCPVLEGGITVEGWQAGKAYSPNNIVIHNSILYICIKPTQQGAVMSTPENTPTEWERLNGSYKGAYNENESYIAGDIVEKYGSIYQANRNNPQTPPDNDMAAHWTVLYVNTNSGRNIKSLSIREV